MTSNADLIARVIAHARKEAAVFPYQRGNGMLHLHPHEWRVVADALAASAERDRLREALGAYRSALRSGERETEQLRAVGDAALTAEQDTFARLHAEARVIPSAGRGE